MSSGFDRAEGLSHGERGAFRVVREFLNSVGYTEAGLLQRFQLPQMDWLFESEGLAGEYLAAQYRDQSLLVYLTRTFIGGYATSQEEARRFLPAGVLEAIVTLGLLQAQDNRLVCPVTLYPSMGFWLVSDRSHGPDGPAYLEQDFVMNMAMNFSQRYVEAIPATPCRRALEIGTGAGLGALVLARCAEEVWATDITDRSLHFAAFNAQLNGLDNIRFVKGDLFEPVPKLDFDRVASHPPFEPAVKGGNFVYSAGGEDGEELLARLIAACPEYIAAGGRAYINIAGTDRRGEPLQARVRRWLGKDASEFDVGLFVRLRRTPMEYARDLVFSENKDPASLSAWEALYERIEAEQVIVGYLILQRAIDRTVFTIRRNFGPKTTAAEMEWLLDWEGSQGETSFRERLLAAKPQCTTSGWDLLIRHRMVDGELIPADYEFRMTVPFEETVAGQPWMTAFLDQCDGSRSCAEWLSGQALAEATFVEGVARLAAAGVLRLNPNW